MCFSCPPASASFCFACGTDHHQVLDQTPTQAPTSGALVASISNGSLAAMPEELTCRIFSFTPDSAPMFGIVSRELHRIMGVFVQVNATDIFAQCSSENSLLGRYIHELEAQHKIDLRLMSLPGRGMEPVSLSDCNGILSRLSMNVHFSIVRRIRSLGVITCPNTLLSPQEVAFFNEATQSMQNANLQRVWSRMQPEFQALIPPLAGLPAVDAPAQEIRTWMHAEDNQALLQEVAEPDLHNLGLTCVPLEIGLLTGLESLDLNNNQLTSFPENLLQRFSRLQVIDLGCNQLASFPANLFQGLPQLRSLHLNHNLLTSIPDALFHGLSQLRRLTLEENLLTSLPETLFRELSGLEWIILHHNQLTSLPQTLFHNLSGLQVIALQSNQIALIPEGLFQGLTALRSLLLDDNPGLMVSYNDLPAENNIAFRDSMRNFFNYECRSPLARLYQLAARGGSPEAVRESFSALPVTIKNTIYGKIWDEAGRPNTDDPRWGENHALEDMGIFNGALKRHVRESFDRLNNKQKNAVYGHVYHLARRERGAREIDFSAPNWGELHAFDNILRLIDAMSQRQG